MVRLDLFASKCKTFILCPLLSLSSSRSFSRIMSSRYVRASKSVQPIRTSVTVKRKGRKKKRSHSHKTTFKKSSTKTSPDQPHHKKTTPTAVHIQKSSSTRSSIITIDPDTPPFTRKQTNSTYTFPRIKHTHSVGGSHTSFTTPTQFSLHHSLRSTIPVIQSSWSLSSNISTIRSMSYWRSVERGGRVGGGEKEGGLTMATLAKGLAKMQYKHIIVMSGAGISTSSGIPDFRTPGTGLYDNLQQYRIPEPSAIFDIAFFSRNPRPFFTLAKELYPGHYTPNVSHYFIKLLQDKGYLHRNYTQNIDGLERLAGIKAGKLVEAHGSFATASCTLCHAKHDPDHVKTIILNDRTPYCKHKYCKGVVKPDIVFFGEDLPQKFYALRHSDLSRCDLLIIMGTSLEVEPFASLATLTKFDVPRVLINRELVGPFKHQRKRPTDLILTGDIVNQVTELIKLAGWEKELNDIVTTSSSSKDSSLTGKLDTVEVLSVHNNANNDKCITINSSTTIDKQIISEELRRRAGGGGEGEKEILVEEFSKLKLTSHNHKKT